MSAGQASIAPVNANGSAPSPVSDAQRRRLDEAHREAVKLLSLVECDFDRAIQLLLECVQADPGNLTYVDTFLDCLARKHRESKGSMSSERDADAELSRAAGSQDWSAVLQRGPELLSSNPWHVPTLRTIAEATGALGNLAVELRYLSSASEFAPDDAPLNRQFARALMQVGQFDEALACWRRVEEAEPEDSEAPEMIVELTVENCRCRAGLKDSTIAPSAAVALAVRQQRDQTAKRNREARRRPVKIRKHENPFGVKYTPIQALEHTIRDNPTNVDAHLELAELYVRDERDYDAEKLLQRGIEATGDNVLVREMWEEIRLLRSRKRCTLAERRVEVEATSDAREALTETRREHHRLELEILAGRCAREPENAALQVEVGIRLKRLGKFNEACQRFNQALNDALHRPAAALELGECQEQFEQYPQALTLYRQAFESAVFPGHFDLKKEALYHAGILAARIKLFKQAKHYLTELLRLDPQYKEAAAKLNEIAHHVA